MTTRDRRKKRWEKKILKTLKRRTVLTCLRLDYTQYTMEFPGVSHDGVSQAGCNIEVLKCFFETSGRMRGEGAKKAIKKS